MIYERIKLTTVKMQDIKKLSACVILMSNNGKTASCVKYATVKPTATLTQLSINDCNLVCINTP